MHWGRRIRGYRTAALACLLLGVVAAPADAYTAAYTDVDGHTITIVAAGSAPDTARDQLFVDVLGSLAHGEEMNLLTIDFTASDAGHDEECSGAPACYSYGSSPGRIHIRGFDTGGDPGSEADNVPLTEETMPRDLLAHEYGHHLANHRLNDGALEGGASANGTKRWASYMRICPRVRKGELGGPHYSTLPSEGFAESYRAAHYPATLEYWMLDPLLVPDATAIELIREDALDPYAGPSTKRLHGRFRRPGRDLRTKRLRTPLDGRLAATLTTTGSLRARLSLTRGRHRKRVARYRRGRQELVYDVCGARQLRLDVERVSGSGTYTITVTRP